MREILFRGTRVDNGEWVEGFLVSWKNWNEIDLKWSIHYGIISTEWCNTKPKDCIEVIPETVSQFTGLTDKNVVKIFEGDIIRYSTSINGKENIMIGNVFWSEFRASFALGNEYTNNDLYKYVQYNRICEVIGNIFDNPELLK